MLPVIFIIALLLLSSFFIHLYLSIKIIILFFIIFAFILFFLNKKFCLFFIISIAIFFLYHEYQLSRHLSIHQMITQGKKFSGIVLNKKELDKKYLYLVNLYACQINGKKEIVDAQITVVSHKNILLGDYIFIPYIFFIQKYDSIEQLKKNPFSLSSHASGIASNIKINMITHYKKAYSFFTFLFGLKERFHNELRTYFIDRNKFFFDTIFLGKMLNNKKYRHLFSIWGISHFLARSGLHIQICITVLISFFLFLGFSYSVSALIQLFILFLFYFFTFPSISFFRAFLMFFLFLICKLLKLPTTSLHTLSATIIITFFIYPFCFLQLGSQLTFFTTGILALVSYVNRFSKKE
jgi:hypothetical protein